LVFSGVFIDLSAVMWGRCQICEVVAVEGPMASVHAIADNPRSCMKGNSGMHRWT